MPNPLPPRPAADRVERVAHRGAPTERLENTLPGFVLAVERGADAVELDVHTTMDDVVVVHHDEIARGLTIARSRWADLERLDLGGGATMPRLDDVLRSVGDQAIVYVELKGSGIEDAVIDVLRQRGKRYALHSFDHDAIARVARRSPEIARGALLDRDTRKPLDALRHAVERLAPRDIWPHYSLVDEAFTAAAKELGVRVVAWTVNSVATAKRLRTLGVDALCTDDVRMLVNL